jgi:hypothetical protein
MFFWQRYAGSFEDGTDSALCLGAQDDGIAVVLDGDLLQAIEIAQGIPPFGLDAGFVAACLKLLSQDQGEEGAEDMAADGSITGVIDWPGLEQRLGASKEFLHLEKVTVAQHGLERCDPGPLWQAQDEDAVESRFIGELAGIDLEGGFDRRSLLVSARGSSQTTPIG